MAKGVPLRNDVRGQAEFASALVVIADRVVFESETATHAEFVADLFSASSPLVGLVPTEVLHQQCAFQRIGHETAFPDAVKLIVKVAGQAVGRIIVDWGVERTRCVDIAIMPVMQRRGLGTDILTVWLNAACSVQATASLTVRYDNPAIALYERLGFIRVGDGAGPMLEMTRTW